LNAVRKFWNSCWCNH